MAASRTVRLATCCAQLAAAWLLTLSPLVAQSSPPAGERLRNGTTTRAASTAQPTDTKTSVPPARQTYMGRRIAQTMSYKGAPWLLRSEREKEEACSRMLQELQLEPGMVVCDLGCGNGFYTLRMADLVGRKGHVFAVDIQPQMLVLLRQRMETKGVTNVSPILGSIYDPRLPAQTVDLILLVDVYHEFSHPELMLRAMRRALKEDGVIALLEYRAEDPTVPIKPLHKMTKKQAIAEFSANGFRVRRQFDGLPWQHMLIFEKDPRWSPKSDSRRDSR